MLKIIKPGVSRKEIESLAKEIEGVFWMILGVAIIWPIVAIATADINSIAITACFAAMTILSGMCILISLRISFKKNIHHSVKEA